MAPWESPCLWPHGLCLWRRAGKELQGFLLHPLQGRGTGGPAASWMPPRRGGGSLVPGLSSPHREWTPPASLPRLLCSAFEASPAPSLGEDTLIVLGSGLRASAGSATCPSSAIEPLPPRRALMIITCTPSPLASQQLRGGTESARGSSPPQCLPPGPCQPSCGHLISAVCHLLVIYGSLGLRLRTHFLFVYHWLPGHRKPGPGSPTPCLPSMAHKLPKYGGLEVLGQVSLVLGPSTAHSRRSLNAC